MDFARKHVLCCLFLTCFFIHPVLANNTSSPCGEHDDLFLFIDRPSLQDNACVVPDKAIVLETGYQYQKLLDEGTQQNFPAAVVRTGIANQWEFNISLPNYIKQTVFPSHGFSEVILGAKRQIGGSDNWVTAVEGFVILPSGSAAFGSRKSGETINGVFSYNLTTELNLSGMFGVSSQSQAIDSGGGRYWTFNPDLVLAWSKSPISLFAEIYGQSKTAPDQGSGFNSDIGILYLVRKNIVIDLEVGQRISGELGGFERYIGTGISIQLA